MAIVYSVRLMKLLYEAVFESVGKAILSSYSRHVSPTIRKGHAIARCLKQRKTKKRLIKR
jgi:hypothetical protein